MIVVHASLTRFGAVYTAMTRTRVVFATSAWGAAVAAVLAYVGGVHRVGEA